MLVLTVNERKTYQFDPKDIASATKLSGSQTLLMFDGGRNITVDLPRDVLFMILRGRRELPKIEGLSGDVRAQVKQDSGPIFLLALFPVEKPDMILKCVFRSKESSIYLI